MFFGTIGILSGGSFPPAGTLLSSFCQSVSGYDNSGTYYNGTWSSVGVYANGSGGSYYAVIGDNVNGCWHPSGWFYVNSSNDESIAWTHGMDSGNFVYGYSFDTSYADGAGGAISASGTNITASHNTVVHSYEGYDYTNNWPTNELLRFSTTNGPELYTSSVPAPGVVIDQGCSSINSTDAWGVVWEMVPASYTTYADGFGGSGTSYEVTGGCGYLPSGYYTSAVPTEYFLYYTDQFGNQSAPWHYETIVSYEAADGTGGSYSGTFVAWSALYGDYIYSYYDEAGQQMVFYYYNGMGGYYVSYQQS